MEDSRSICGGGEGGHQLYESLTHLHGVGGEARADDDGLGAVDVGGDDEIGEVQSDVEGCSSISEGGGKTSGCGTGHIIVARVELSGGRANVRG